MRAILALLLMIVAAPLAAAERDVPYVPTPASMVATMLDMAELKPGERLLDLGSGDGRIPIAAAKRGAVAEGVDIDSRLVARARNEAEIAGVTGRATFRTADLFETPVREADVVTLYLLPAINARLRPRLLFELRPGARVVSHAFDMGDWTPDATRVVDGRTAYLWIVPAIAGGAWTLTMADGRTRQLVIEQRYQKVSGTLDGVAISGAVLRGDRLGFTAGAERFEAVVGPAALSPAAGGVAGWRATRVE